MNLKDDPRYKRWDQLVTKVALSTATQEEYEELRRVDAECREAGLLPKIEGNK